MIDQLLLNLPTPVRASFSGAALLLAVTLLANSAVQAQELGNAPYSRLGIGEAAPGAGQVRNQGMGGTGVAAPNSAYVNDLNPALALYTQQVTFDVGISSQLKTLRSGDVRQRTGNATLGYFALALPISKNWGAVVGLRPFSTVSYQSRSVIAVNGDPNGRVEVRYTGEGGLSQAYLAHGIRLAGGLSVGAEAAFTFGSVDRTTSSQLLAGTNVSNDNERHVFAERRRYGDFLFRGGLAYRQKLNDRYNLSAGSVLQFGSSLHVTRRRTQERRNAGTDGVFESILIEDSVRTRTALPYQLRGGLALDDSRGKLLTVDFQFQPWSRFRADGVAQTVGSGNAGLRDALLLRAGAEWTPDANSVESYARRVTYRLGLYGGQTGIADAQGRDLRDMGVTWGFALPLSKASTFESTTIQTSFTYGRRDSGSGALKEDYVRAQLSLSLGSTWFVKRRID